MNGKTPGRPGRPRRPMTREEYEKMTAERLRRAKAARRNKRRKTALSVILCLVFVASAVFIVYKVKSGSNYRDPAERLGDSPSATIPSGVNTDPVTTAPATEPTDGGGSGSFKFIAAGDNIIHSAVFEDARKRAGGSGYDFLSMYNGIADTVKSADVKYVNQETPMAGASYGIQGYPSFNSPQEAGDALVALGFNTVNIATNHMLDMGTSGLADSIKYWKTKDVTLLGAYTKSDYDNIRVQEAGGIKIAWLVFYVVYLKKNILNRKISCFLKREFINLSTGALIFVIGKYTLTFLDISNYAQWALAAVVITVLACLITIGSNFLFYRNDCIALLRKAMHRG